MSTYTHVGLLSLTRGLVDLWRYCYVDKRDISKMTMMMMMMMVVVVVMVMMMIMIIVMVMMITSTTIIIVMMIMVMVMLVMIVMVMMMINATDQMDHGLTHVCTGSAWLAHGSLVLATSIWILPSVCVFYGLLCELQEAVVRIACDENVFDSARTLCKPGCGIRGTCLNTGHLFTNR